MSSQELSVLGQARRTQEHEAEAWLANWLTEYVATLMDLPPDEIDPEQTFARFGLDSASSLGMTGDLAELLECRIAESLAFEHPTIQQLSRYLGAKAEIQRACARRLAAKHPASIALQAR